MKNMHLFISILVKSICSSRLDRHLCIKVICILENVIQALVDEFNLLDEHL